MTLAVPVTNEYSVVILRVGIWDGNEQPAVHAEAAKATSCTMHGSCGIVDVAPNLVLNLEVICVVRARGNGAHGSQHSILPRVLPMLDAMPRCQINQVENINIYD